MATWSASTSYDNYMYEQWSERVAQLKAKKTGLLEAYRSDSEMYLAALREISVVLGIPKEQFSVEIGRAHV